MSSSQFENSNPYSSQNSNLVVSDERGSSTQFTILGIIFLVLAVLGIGWSVLTFAGGLMQFLNGTAVPPPNATEAERVGFYIGYWGLILVSSISGFLQILVAWAGINMLRMKGKGVAKIGAIVMCIPCLSTCYVVGMPFGIWAIIALNGNSAKQNFQT